MTHDDLVERARLWLYNNCVLPPTKCYAPRRKITLRKPRCGLVLTEIGCEEKPDALGFAYTGRTSILVECKVSVSDFHQDKQKPFRKDLSKGVGEYRYYMAPKGLLKPRQIPEKWGLIEVTAKQCRVKVLPFPIKDRNHDNERYLMYSWAAWNCHLIRKEALKDAEVTNA